MFARSCLILKNVCCLLVLLHAGVFVQLFSSELTSPRVAAGCFVGPLIAGSVEIAVFSLVFSTDIGMYDMKYFRGIALCGLSCDR